MRELRVAPFLPIMLVASLTSSIAFAEGAPPPIGRPHTCDAYYPPALQAQGVEGTTVLSFRVTRHGRVSEITVSESSGNADLDAAAVFCAQRWKYLPATQGGRPVEVPWVAKVVWQIPEPAPTAPAKQ